MSMIKFGIRSFKLKTYSLEEFDIKTDPNSRMWIEYRQNYFHLLLIPLFPIDKVLQLRKGDNQLYELPANLHSEVEAKIKDKLKTPWYTYLGPIVLALGLGIYFGKIMLGDYRSKQYRERVYEAKALRSMEHLEKINGDDYIKLMVSDPMLVLGKFIKIERTNGDSILIKKMYTDLGYSEDVSHLIKSYYLKNRNSLDSVWIHKRMLRKAICADYDSLFQTTEFGVDFFNEDKKYLIDYIERIDYGPILKNAGSGGYNYVKKELSLHLHNYGMPCEIIEIQNLKGDIRWMNELPYYISSNDHGGIFNLAASNYEYDTDFEFILHLRVQNGEIIKYNIKGKNVPTSVSRLE